MRQNQIDAKPVKMDIIMITINVFPAIIDAKLVIQDQLVKTIIIANHVKMNLSSMKTIALMNAQKNIMKTIKNVFYVINYVIQQVLIAIIVQVVLKDIIY